MSRESDAGDRRVPGVAGDPDVEQALLDGFLVAEHIRGGEAQRMGARRHREGPRVERRGRVQLVLRARHAGGIFRQEGHAGAGGQDPGAGLAGGAAKDGERGHRRGLIDRHRSALEGLVMAGGVAAVVIDRMDAVARQREGGGGGKGRSGVHGCEGGLCAHARAVEDHGKIIDGAQGQHGARTDQDREAGQLGRPDRQSRSRRQAVDRGRVFKPLGARQGGAAVEAHGNA